MSKSNASILFFGIYFVEAVASYVIFTILSYYLNNVLFIPPIIIGVLGSISLLPMILKTIFAPIINKYKIRGIKGQYRPYILIGVLINAVFISLFFIPQCIMVPSASLGVILIFLFVWFFQSLGLSLMDVGVDAVGTLYKEKMAPMKISVLMFLGTTIGEIVPMIFLTPFFILSYPLGFIITGLISLTGLFFIWIFKEERIDVEIKPNFEWSVVKDVFRKSSMIMALVLAFLIIIDNGIFEFTLERFVYIAYHWTLRDLAVINLTLLIGAIVGMFLGYYFSRQLKPKMVLFLTSVSIFIPELIWAVLFPLGLLTLPIFYVTSIISASGSALYAMAVTALFLDITDPRIGPTMIVIFFTTMNAGKLVGILVGGFLPFIGVFALAAILSGGRTVLIQIMKNPTLSEESWEKNHEKNRVLEKNQGIER
ncbi:MAG: MFS transporter [Candidatus Helarchaeales archaeon]